jgi:hypothetical protein
MKAADVLFEAIRRIDSWPRIVRALGGLDARYVRVSDREIAEPQLTLSTEASVLLADLSVERGIRETCARSKLADFEVCRTIGAFRVIGLVRRVDAAPVETRPTVRQSELLDDDGLGLALAASAGTLPPLVPASPAMRDDSCPPAKPADDPTKRRVLIVGVPREFFQKIEPLLCRSSLAVDRIPRPESALELCAQRRFELVIARSSFTDMPIDTFLAGLQGPQSKCAQAQVLLLADDVPLEESRPVLRDGRPVVLPLQAPARVLDEIAMRVLGVEPRQSQRLTIRVQVVLAQGRQLLMCQTENISRLGMLLRSEQPFPVGTKLAFDFTPPGERTPIHGEAQVVRHSDPDMENVRGVGVKLLGFQGDGRARWEGFLARSAS